MAATLGRDSSGKLMRKAGIMSVVLESGPVHPGDCIGVELPPAPHIRLKPI
jgi:MOSC domain-containing protein YiiM